MNVIEFANSLRGDSAPLVCFTTHTRFFVNEGSLEAWTTKTRMHQSEKLLYKGASEAELFDAILKYENAITNKCKCKTPVAFIDHGVWLECNHCHGWRAERITA